MPNHFELLQWQASDGMELCGFLSGGRKKHVAIYLHGLGGNGYRSTMMQALAATLGRSRMGLFAINTRGHDIVSRLVQGRKRTITNGSVYEIFTECVHDVRGAMTFLKSRGVTQVSLIGHSTGANKIAYAMQRRVRVRGLTIRAVVYLAPGDDIGAQQAIIGPRRYRAMQTLAGRLAKKDPHQLMPEKNIGYLPISAASYLSLYGPRNRMDQFPFRDLRCSTKWRRLERGFRSAAIVLGADDAWLPAPARAVQAFLAEAYPRLPVVIIPRAGHSFTGREQAMARQVLAVIRGTC
jgi:pimeloyl-ACP methyl ester carboxylesterase